MVFTSPSYMLVIQYSALVEFKTRAGTNWARPGLEMPALWPNEVMGSQTQRWSSRDAAWRSSGLTVFQTGFNKGIMSKSHDKGVHISSYPLYLDIH